METPDNSGRTPLHLAAAQGLDDVAFDLLSHGAEVNVQDGSGSSPLLLACSKFATTSMIELLLNHNADANLRDNSSNSPLILCIKQELLSLTQTLLKYHKLGLVNLNINQSDRNAKNPLYYAIKTGQVEVVRELLESGADTNYRDDFGNSFIHIIGESRTNSHDCLKLLIGKGLIDLNIQNNNGNTPLHVFCSKNMVKEVSVLLNNGVDVSVRNRKDETALLSCISAENTSRFLIESILLTNESILDVQDKTGNSALHRAVSMQSYDSVLTLLEKGALCYLMNHNSDCAFDIAFKRDDQRMMWIFLRNDGFGECRQLREPSLFVDLKSPRGYTLLHYACMLAHCELILKLLQAGASSVLLTSDGETPWYLFVQTWEKSIITVDDFLLVLASFISKNGHIDITFPNLDTTLHRYDKHYRNHSVSVRCTFLFLKHGCRINAVNGDGKLPFQDKLMSDEWRTNDWRVYRYRRLYKPSTLLLMLLSAGSKMHMLFSNEFLKLEAMCECLSNYDDLWEVRNMTSVNACTTRSRNYLESFVGEKEICQSFIGVFTSPLTLKYLCLQVVRINCFPNAWVAAQTLPVPKVICDLIRPYFSEFNKEYLLVKPSN